MENSIPSHLSLPENSFMLVIDSICKIVLAIHDIGSKRNMGIKISERDTEIISHSTLFLELGISF